MRPMDEDRWIAEYWDEYIKEFGFTAYFDAREEQYGNALRYCNDAAELGSDTVAPGDIQSSSGVSQ